MSHRKEPREVGGIYPSQQYVVIEPKKRKVLTPAQRAAGRTWIFPSEPERPYVVGEKPASTTILKPPETYATWLPIAGPERPYVAGDKPPRKTDVTLIVAPPSVRAELQQREYAERVAKAEASRAFRGNIQQRLYGVQTKLAATETSLRELSLIQQQRAKGFEFVEKKGGQLYFVPKETKGIAEAFLGIHVPSLPEILGYSVPTPPELLGFGRMEPKHYTMTEPLAGFVAAFEQPIYTVGRLAGFETPRPPPSLLSGHSLEHPAYAAGAFAGQVVQAYFFGKVIEKSPLGPPLAKVEMWTMSKIREPLIGTGLDKFLLQHSKYWATLQEYKAGTVVFGAAPKKWSPSVYHGKTTTPFSATLKKAIMDTRGSVLLPQLLTTPKTLFTPSATVLPGAFLPQIIGVTTVLGLETLQAPKTLGIETLQLPKQKSILETRQTPKPINISRMRQTVMPKQLQRQTPIAFNIPITRPKQREELIQFSGVIESLTPVITPIEQQKQSQAQAQSLKQLQIQSQVTQFKTKRLQLQMPKTPRFNKGLFGKWFKRTHQIKTAQQMWQTFTGKPMRTKKRKKIRGVKLIGF